MKNFNFMIVIVLFFLGGCKKPNCEPEIISFPKSFADIFNNYQIGNYWVYESNLGKIDSIYVINSSDQSLIDVTFTPGKGRNCGTTTRQVSSQIHSLYLNIGNDLITIINTISNSEMNKPTIGFYTNFSNNSSTFFHFSDFVNFNQLNDYVLNSRTYTNCIKIDYNSVSYYWKEKIGLVGWSNNFTTFNLLNYFIK